MSGRSPRFLVQDDGPKPHISIGNLQHAIGDVKAWPTFPIQDYQRYDAQLIMMPTYVEHDVPYGISISTGNSRLAPIQSPPSRPETLHDPIPDEEICLACEEVDVRNLLGLRGGRSYQLGYAVGIFNCSNCAICRIVTKGIEFDTATAPGDLARQHPDAFVILTSNWATFPTGARHDRIYDLIARLYKPPGLCIGRARMRLLSDDASRIRRSPFMRGRLVDAGKANLDLARSWLAECEEKHDCDDAAHRQPRDHTEKFLLVLDVEQGCLVEISSQSRYLTLSYVWPRLPSLRLYGHLLDDWKKPKALFSTNQPLLNVCQDAIAITQQLGEKYIWIDQLCMVQDDPFIKRQLVDMMDKVYGLAILNIVVASSTSPQEDYRIPGASKPRGSRQTIATIEGLRFVTALRDFNAALGQSWWSTRGWTFQESVLAQRCLIFHDDQMYFRCRSDSRSEDVTAEGNTEFEVHPAKPKARNSGFEHLLNTRSFSNVSRNDCFVEYLSLVRDYSRRSLTHEADILAAFKGIMVASSSYLKAHLYFCGLPWKYFHRALLWYPASPVYRRMAKTDESSDFIWPSWSWAGWVGRVDYEMDILQLGDTRTTLPVTAWYRYEPQTEMIQPVGGSAADIESPPDPPFAFGLLCTRIPLLRENPTRIVGWGTSFKSLLDPHEKPIVEWLTDDRQSVPCFAIIDAQGDSCGYLPSVDRDWSRRYKENLVSEVEMICLSYAQQSVGEEHFTRINLIHPKYKVVDNPIICFYNVMLVEYDELGIAYRRGIGRVHTDYINPDILRDTERRIIVLG